MEMKKILLFILAVFVMLPGRGAEKDRQEEPPSSPPPMPPVREKMPPPEAGKMPPPEKDGKKPARRFTDRSVWRVLQTFPPEERKAMQKMQRENPDEFKRLLDEYENNL